MSEPTIDFPPPQPEGELPPHLVRKLKIAVPGFKLISVIGRGGQAIVLKGIQHSTGKTVAIKLLREGRLADPTARERLQREVAVLATLQHPNIVGIIDRGVTPDGYDYLVMDFIAGQSLKGYLEECRSVAASNPGNTVHDPATPLKLFTKICLAIDFAHKRGIIHRDLCPSNILVDERGEPQILDFGLARTTFDQYLTDRKGNLSITGQFLGKLAYASPEQARGEPSRINSATDVYSLGVILYEIITGEYPYKVVGNIAEVLNNIIHSPPTPPSELLAAKDAKIAQAEQSRQRDSAALLNPAIEAIALKALAKNVPDRYQSAAELARDVESYLAGQPTIARLSESQKVVAPKKRWKPATRQSIIAAASVVLFLSAFALFRWSGSDNPPGAESTPETQPQSAEQSSAIAVNDYPAPFVRGGTWRIEGDELMLEPLVGLSSIGFGDPRWTDYDFSFKVKAVDGATRPGLIVHWPDRGRNCVIRLGSDSNPTHEIIHIAKRRKPNRLAARNGQIAAGEWYDVLVKLRGPKIWCFVNGGQLFELDNIFPREGRVGFTVRGAARYRDIRVTTPDGAILWDGLPDLTRAEKGPDSEIDEQ